MDRETKEVRVMIDADLVDRLAEVARRDRRTVTGQVAYILEEYLRRESNDSN